MLVVNDKYLCANCFAEATPADADICPACGYDHGTIPVNTGALPLGSILRGQYRIGKTLGQGAFGITYLAYDMKIDRRVAIKEYYPDNLSSRQPGTLPVITHAGKDEGTYESGKKRFYQEAETIARFNGNVNIINVFDFFYENNTAYYVMEYVDGADLKRYLEKRGGVLSFNEAYDIFKPLLYALRVVHAQDVTHRDISPDNIYITKDGGVKLLDFGSARDLVGEKTHTVMFKDGFSPLEQYSRKRIGKWSDIYALGATMYYMLTGMRPISSMERIPDDPLRMPSAYGRTVPAWFEAVLKKMLAVHVQDRYMSTGEVLIDIDKGPDPKREGPLRRLRDRPKRKGKKKWAIFAGAVVLLAAAAVAVTLLISSGDGLVEDKPYTMSVGKYEVKGTYTGMWSGGAPNGEGAFTVTEENVPYRRNDVFTGTFAAGVLEGEGVIDRASGGKYEGYFEKGLQSGQGTETAGGETYSGAFKEGLRWGEGTLTYADGSSKQVVYEEGELASEAKGEPANAATPTVPPATVAPVDTSVPSAPPTQGATVAPVDTPQSTLPPTQTATEAPVDTPAPNAPTATPPQSNVYDGDEKDGQPEGVGKMAFANGDVYIGEWAQGVRDGLGVYTYADGAQTIAQRKDDKLAGYTVFLKPDGAKFIGQYQGTEPNGIVAGFYTSGRIFMGEWEGASREGFGVWIGADGEIQEIGVYENDAYVGKPFSETAKGTYTYANGDVYEGDMVNGKREGYGMLTCADGRVFEGYFEGGTFVMGYARRANGQRVVGRFAEYEPNGVCALIFPGDETNYDGVHVGEYTSGVRNGIGAFLWIDKGDAYVGDFINNQREGKGIYIWPSGSVYVGAFEKSVRQGEGVLTLASGTVQRGTFENAEFKGEAAGAP